MQAPEPNEHEVQQLRALPKVRTRLCKAHIDMWAGLGFQGGSSVLGPGFHRQKTYIGDLPLFETMPPGTKHSPQYLSWFRLA